MRIMRGLGALALTCAVTSCAFHFDDLASAPGACKSDADCADLQICSEVTNTCEVNPPTARPFALEGPFECSTSSEIIEVDFGTIGVAAAWETFGSFPAGNATLTSRCQSIFAGNDLLVILDGPRFLNPDFGQVGFYRAPMVIPVDQIGPGSPRHVDVLGFPGTGGQDVFSGLYFCPANSIQLGGPWYDALSVEGCFQMFDIFEGDILFTRGNIERVEGRVAGYLAFPLTPTPEALQ